MGQGIGNMPVYSPLFEAVGIEMSGGVPPATDPFGGLNWIDVPEGIAFPLQRGQRWVLDLHYINPSDKPMLVNTGFNVGTIPENEVTAWASTLQFDAGAIDLPPGDSEVSFRCPWEEDLTVLSIMGHMHEFGTYYRVDWNKENGDVEQVYEVPEWTTEHKEWPQLTYHAPGTMEVKAGEEFTTVCKWNNPTDAVLPYPAEMCTTLVVVYPLTKPLTCVLGTYEDY